MSTSSENAKTKKLKNLKNKNFPLWKFQIFGPSLTRKVYYYQPQLISLSTSMKNWSNPWNQWCFAHWTRAAHSFIWHQRWGLRPPSEQRHKERKFAKPYTSLCLRRNVSQTKHFFEHRKNVRGMSFRCSNKCLVQQLLTKPNPRVYKGVGGNT